MEIFVAFTKDSQYVLLKGTLEAWEKIPGAEPVGIQVPAKKYEVVRRVTAENMAAGDYILCDLGCVPNQDDIISRAEKLLEDETIGMLFVGDFGRFAGGIRICRKGVIEKWPKNETGTYDKEHGEAYRSAGYFAGNCPTLQYRILGVH